FRNLVCELLDELGRIVHVAQEPRARSRYLVERHRRLEQRNQLGGLRGRRAEAEMQDTFKIVCVRHHGLVPRCAGPSAVARRLPDIAGAGALRMACQMVAGVAGMAMSRMP